jgi:hypothetical protein
MWKVLQFLIILVILSIFLQDFLLFIKPLIPYMAVIIIVVLVGGFAGRYFYRRRRNW